MRAYIVTFILVFFTLTPLASADEFPQRKAGLWELATSFEGMPGASQKMKQCIDVATDAELMKLGKRAVEKMGAVCSRNEIVKSGDTYVHEANCVLNGQTKLVSQTVYEGDFSKQYEARSVVSYSPPMMGMSDQRSTVTANYLGPCEAGQSPGDVVLPNGKVMTLNAFRKMTTGQ